MSKTSRSLRNKVGYAALIITCSALIAIFTVSAFAIIPMAPIILSSAIHMWQIGLLLVNLKVLWLFLFGFTNERFVGTVAVPNPTQHNLVPKLMYSVGLGTFATTGVINGGADFGNDTLLNLAGPTKTTSYGIAEGAQTIQQASPLSGTLYISAGTYNNFPNYVLITATNTTIVADPQAIISLPALPSWNVTSGNNQRNPLFLISTCTNFRWTGGQFTQNSPVNTVARNVMFLVADNNTKIEIDHCNFTNLNCWPILLSGNYIDVNIGTTHSGPYVGFEEHHNTMTNCGNLAFPDGGGCRVSNTTTPSVLCSDITLGQGTIITFPSPTTGGLFGYDFTNPSASGAGPITNITINNPKINMGVNTGVSPQRIGLNFEGNQSAIPCSDVYITNPHVTGGFRGMQISGGWADFIVSAGTYELAWQQGIQCYTTTTSNFFTLTDVQFLGPRVKNNNQGGASTLRTAGLEIGFDANTGGSGTGNLTGGGIMNNIVVAGGVYADTQSSPTQQYGISINNLIGSGAGGLLTNVSITGGSVYGNIVSTNPTFGIGANLGGGVSYNISINSVTGYDPGGNIATPFSTLGMFIWSNNGGTNVITSGQAYSLCILNGTFTVTGGTGVSILLTDGSGNTTLVNGASSVSNQTFPYGAIATITFSSQPTITVATAGQNIANFTTVNPYRFIGIFGSSSTFVASKDYAVGGPAIYLNVTGAGAITIKDPTGATVQSPGTTYNGILQPGFKFFATGTPTITAFGA